MTLGKVVDFTLGHRIFTDAARRTRYGLASMNAPFLSVSGPVRGYLKFRSIFISDTHLGTRGCRGKDFLADFLKRTSCHESVPG